MYFVGIDAGGTKTEFLLCDENEKEIKKVVLGAGNPNDIGIDACIMMLSKGLDELCEDIIPDAVFAGVSGGGYGENCARIREFLASRFPKSVIDNGPDVQNLLYCSSSDESVGALICGTGTALFVRDGEKITRFGGWGNLFDGGGSAYDIGRDAICYLLECEECFTEELSSPLNKLVREKLGASAHESLTSIYAKGKSYIASFAPLVFQAYEQSDPTSAAIIEKNVNAVAIRIAFSLSTLENRPMEIICAGGLFNSAVFYDMLAQKVKLPLVISLVSPSVGACRCAMRLVDKQK